MDIHVRAVTDNRDLHRVPALERAIWGNPDPIPDSLLRVMVDHGGGVWVAHPPDEPDRWLGFVAGLAGRDGPGWHLHSHLAGVLEGFRGQGIGLALKTEERRWALHHGYTRIVWTFDPLRAPNAQFNIERLGVRVLAYREDYYGSLASLLNGALPTDRLVVEWPANPTETSARSWSDRDPRVFIPIPPDLDALVRRSPDEAHRMLQAVREAFRRHLGKGFEVTGFIRDPGRPGYVLRQPLPPSPPSNQSPVS